MSRRLYRGKAIKNTLSVYGSQSFDAFPKYARDKKMLWVYGILSSTLGFSTLHRKLNYFSGFKLFLIFLLNLFLNKFRCLYMSCDRGLLGEKKFLSKVYYVLYLCIWQHSLLKIALHYIYIGFKFAWWNGNETIFPNTIEYIYYIYIYILNKPTFRALCRLSCQTIV